MTNLLLQNSGGINFGDTMLVFVIGFVLIMVVLALLIGVIYLMRWILKMFQPMSKLKAAATATEAVAKEKKPVALAKGSCGELCLNNVSEKDAAMVMAIVADQLQTPLNQLRFKSIKQIGEDK